MARTLILPDRMAPSNLHLRKGVKTRFVENDVFDIANRIKAIDERLYILEMTENDDVAWVIMERCSDGVERRVLRVDNLDASVLEELRYMMAVPLQQRLAMAEAEVRKHDEDQKDNELEELYENMGGEMRRELHRCGFINAPAPVSFYVAGR